MDFQIKATPELSAEELLAIFIERVAVFVVEQECPYQEADQDDQKALHVCLADEQGLKAYARIIDREDDVTFGRVLVVKSARKQQLGQKLVQRTLQEIQQRFPDKSVTISAQAYLRKFYEGFGFEVVSDIYLEDNIPHVDMRLSN
ncbi:GNAT family N-acetyltransferase [Enterococcus sp. 669A]|uniref:GNAT family N-acetyltransferase n=1 Tax=Candidatus Enterococcus moelleringii TaxID=2815325 RepID=A0ABS3L6K8_9ENTE|nr:GNAT family N-acetyltransferase [Enterococcus sp. 669A]MBO1305242.1 GNAT family N-acetyltransferase [Enterococcus sp. 669A]